MSNNNNYTDAPADIAQALRDAVLLEDLLEKFLVAVDDFYEDLNKSSKVTSYQ